MTPPGKLHHVVLHSCTPRTGAAVRRWSPVEGRSCDNLMAHGNRNCGNRLPDDSGCGFLPDLDLRQRCWRGFRRGQTSGPRSARQRTVQSTVLRGGVRSWANHSQDGGACQSDLGKKTSLSLFSGAASSSPRAASSLATGLQLASASRAASAPSATPTLSSQASRSRMSTRCTRSTARCSLIECRSESGWGRAA